VVGDAASRETEALLATAHGLPSRHRVVDLLEPGPDRELVARAGLEDGQEARAYLCLGAECSAPVSEPAALRRLAAGAGSGDQAA
jgi:uncharacterized protein YyaL (SSP411 family)